MTLLAALALFVPLLQGLSGTTQSGYDRDLGTVSLPVPAGVSYLTLPLVVPESDRAVEIFGPELHLLETLESWDPATRRWIACHPGRPGALAGSCDSIGQVVRIKSRQPLVLTVRGTPPADGWRAVVKASLPAELFGPLITEPVTFGEVVDALESTGRFALGRDPLHRFDLAAARWLDASRDPRDRIVTPGTTFQAGSTSPPPPDSGRKAAAGESTSTAGVAPAAALPRQTAPALGGAVDSEGTAVSLSAYTETTAPPTDAPGTIAGYKVKKVGAKLDEGVGVMELPAGLRLLTDLPAAVPVKVVYSRGEVQHPVRYELLGLTSLKAGGSASFVEVRAARNALSLVMDTSGRLYGAGRTTVTANQGDGTASLDVLASVYFDPNLSTRVANLSGVRTATGPILDVAVLLGDSARSFERFGTGLSALPLDTSSEVAPGVFRTSRRWLEYSPSALGTFEMTGLSGFADRTLAVELVTRDGVSIDRAECADIDWARWKPPGPLAPVTVSSVTTATQGIARFYASGLAELQAGPNLFFQMSTGGLAILDKFGDGGSGEIGIVPTVAIEAKKNRLGTHRLKIVPTVFLRGQHLAKTSVGEIEDLLLTFTPIVELSVDLGKYMNAAGLSKIKDGLAASWTGSGVSQQLGNAASTSASAVWKALKEGFGLEAGGLQAGIAWINRFEDGSRAHRLSLFASGKLLWTKDSAGKYGAPDTFIDAGGAYERLSLDGTPDPVSPTSLEYRFSRRSSLATTSEFRSYAINSSFSLPREWGWSEDRAMTGSLRFTHEDLGTGKIVNRSAFQSSELLSFSSKIDAVPTFDTGDGDTSFNFDVTDLNVIFSATQDRGVVKRERTIAGSIFAGTAAAAGAAGGGTEGVSEGTDLGQEGEARARGFLLSLSSTWSTTSSEAAAPSTAAGMAAVIEKLFPGPKILGGGDTPRYATEGELLFQNIGTGNWRMESIRGLWVTSGSRLLSIGMGFRPSADAAWAAVSGTVEKEGQTWRIGAEVEKVELRDFWLEEVFVDCELEPPRKWYEGIQLGGTIAWGPGDDPMANANFRLGVTLDFASKAGNLFLKVPGTAFCGDGDCPVTATAMSGTLDFANGWSNPAWDIQASCDFRAAWMEGRTAKMTARFAGTPRPTTFTFTLEQAIPAIELPSGGSASLDTLFVGYDKPSMVYGGSAKIAVPPGLKEILDAIPFVGSRVTVPTQVVADVSGRGSRIQLLGTLSPPLEFALLPDLKFGIQKVRASKASPWGMGFVSVIHAGGTTIPASTSYDPAQKKVLIAPEDSSAKVSFSLGGGSTMEVSGFSLTMYKVGIASKIEIGGTAKVTVGGTSYSGTLAMSVGTDQSASIQLTNLSAGGSGMSLPDFGGMTVSMKGVSISSTKTGAGESAARSVAVTAAVGITLDESIFGPLGGKELVGSVSKDSLGNFVLTVTAGLPPLSIGVEGVSLPFSVELRSLKVVRNVSTGQTSVEGAATLKLLRPINTVLGASGDTPFVIDAAIGVDKSAGKTRVYVRANFTPQLMLAFALLGAQGDLKLPGISVSTEGDLSMALVIDLVKPTTSTLTIVAAISGTAVRFDITADPRLLVDAQPLFTLDFRRLAYNQAFPGFMGVAADLGLNVGTSLFGFGVDISNLLYIVPSSIPPVGFPFFDKISGNLRLLGFGAKAAIALPPPQLALSDAIALVSGLSKAIGRNFWTPLQDFLASKMSGDAAVFRGPGVGDMALALPYALRSAVPESAFPTKTWFPDNPALRLKVIELTILAKMYYATDLFPGDAIAEAIVSVLKIAVTVAKVFSDPMYLINLVPPEHRTGGFALDLGGMLAATASYSIVAPTVYTNDGTAPGLPLFDELCQVAAWVDDSGSSGLPKIRSIIQADALDQDPRPVKNLAFSFAGDAGTTYSGVIDDNWIPLRPYVTEANELRDAASPEDRPISVDSALGIHLTRLNDQVGPLAQSGHLLESGDGKAHLELMGTSASFKVQDSEGKSTLYWGSVPLGYTTTRSVSQGTLEMSSSLKIESRKLVSEVHARLTSSGESSPRDLGRVSRTILKNLDEPAWVTDPQDGRIAGWIARYGLDDASTMRATFTDYGTAKFSGPQKEWTSVYPGALLSDVRLVLRTLQEFKSAIFEYDTSAYSLGLKLWAMFLGSEALRGRVEKITTDGRTIRIVFRSAAAKGAAVEMRIVLEELAYYLSADRNPETAELGDLQGASDISSFRVEDDKIFAEPFSVSLGGDDSQVKELIIFDGSPAVQEMLSRADEQRRALLETDLEQFTKLGLSVSGEPLVVKALRVELDVGQVRATIRPKSILISKVLDGHPLVNVTDGLIFEDWLTRGPYQDQSLYPSTEGIFLTASYGKTNSATTVYDLHEALGTNVLIRTVRVQSPARLAGTFTEMAEGQLHGTLANALGPNGAAAQVTADDTGMRCSLQSSPGPMTLLRDAGGSLSGTVPYAGADRKIEFYWDEATGAKLTKFKYPTGKIEPGGFMGQARMAANLALIQASLEIYGEFKANGYFKFYGDIDLAVIGRQLYGAYYEISSTEGFYIRGQMDVYIARIGIEGRLHAKRGASFTGRLQVLPGGTGLDATVTIDTNAAEKLRIYGSIKVANYTVATQQISIDNNRFKMEWSVGGGSAGASATLSFRYSGGFGIDAQGRAWLKILFGTIRVGIGFSIDSSGNASLCVGPLEIRVNIGRMSVSVSLC